jgi:hypothetical protein
LACCWELKRSETFAAARAIGALPNASEINMTAAKSLFNILLVSVTKRHQPGL